MRHIGVNHSPTPPPCRPEPALLPPWLCPPGGSRPPTAKGLKGPRDSRRQRLEQTRAGEALAAGSEPREAAKPKRVGVSPRHQPGRGLSMGLDTADCPRCAAPSPHLARGCQGQAVGWEGGDGGTLAWWGSPGRAPQGRAGRAKAEEGDRDSGSSWGKGDNTEGHTAPSRPTNPQPWYCMYRGFVPGTAGSPSAPSPQTPPRGDRGAILCPLTPQGTPRALQGRAGSSAGLTWRLLVSLWSQALLVCFCFSGKGRQGVNPSGGAASQQNGCRVQQCCPHTPATAASPGAGLRSAPSLHPRSPASQELGPASCSLHHVTRPPQGWGHLPWCCRDFSPCWAWLCSSSRCGGRVLGKKTLSGHSSPAVYCTLSRFSASPLAVPAETEGSAWLGRHSRAPSDAPPPTGCGPSELGEVPGDDSRPGMTLSRSSPNRVLEMPCKKSSPVALPGRSICWSRAVSTAKPQGFLPAGRSGAGTWHHPPPQLLH